MTPLLVRRYRRDDRQACLELFEGNIPDSFFPHEIPKFMEFLDCFCGPYLVVEESGNVSDINIVSGPMMVRQAALKALRSWKYKPAQLNGQPTAVKMQVTIRFRLP